MNLKLNIIYNSLIFILPLILIVYFRSMSAMFIAILLILFEISLSFDNAVLNAKVLQRMSLVWQKRFLTWGILLAVVGTRIILPILIVSASAFVSPWVVAKLALYDPVSYGNILNSIKPIINTFGGMFLLMVAIKYFINDAKDTHWLHIVESRLSKWGKIESIQIGIALTILTLLAVFANNPLQVLIAGIIGVLTFIYLQMLEGVFAGATSLKSGLILFIYLEVLDASFSLDGVVAAFAITSDILVIMMGLGIGAWFVRQFTISMVRHKTLYTLEYLEHGAHWAVLALALAMLLAVFLHIPEFIIAGLGIFFILASLYASIRKLKT